MRETRVINIRVARTSWRGIQMTCRLHALATTGRSMRRTILKVMGWMPRTAYESRKLLHCVSDDKLRSRIWDGCESLRSLFPTVWRCIRNMRVAIIWSRGQRSRTRTRFSAARPLLRRTRVGVTGIGLRFFCMAFKGRMVPMVGSHAFISTK